MPEELKADTSVKLDYITEGKTYAMNIPATVTVLESRRRIVFKEGRDLNLFDVTKINLDGSWWRLWTADGQFHLINPANVNYSSIS